MLLSCWWALYLWAQRCANRKSAGFSSLVLQISDLEKASFLGRGGDFGFQCLLSSWHFCWDCWSISANCVGFWDMVLEQSSEVAAFCHLPYLDSSLWTMLFAFLFSLSFKRGCITNPEIITHPSCSISDVPYHILEVSWLLFSHFLCYKEEYSFATSSNTAS